MGQDEREMELLGAQLERMRTMLARYSMLFFTHMRVWALTLIGLLVVSLWEPLGAAVLIVPFLVPFVFLEASYLFWYTVFARRHAEWLERTIDERLGRPVLVAHRLEAAYFYPPEGPKVSALSLSRPGSHMSVMTVGYAAGAGLLWLAGLLRSLAWVEAHGGQEPWLGLAVPVAIAWTLIVAVWLAWSWLGGEDERRLVRALDEAYPDGRRPADGSPG